MASSHANLNSGNTSQILADSLINFMNESVNILPNDEANNATSNLISNLSLTTQAICGRELYNN